MKTSTLEEGEASPVDIAQLAAQARAAFDHKRIRECIALTTALAMADPDNTVARALQSVIHMGIQDDLNDVRALLEDSRNRGEAQKYRKAAEIILLKILYLDPAHEEAKELLSYTRALADNSAGTATGAVIPAFSTPTVVAAPAPSARPAHQELATTPVQTSVTEPVLRVTEPRAITEPTPIVMEVAAASGAGHQQEVEEFSRGLPIAAAETAMPATPAFVSMPVTMPALATPARPARDEEFAFTTGAVRAPENKKERKQIPLAFVLVSVVLVGGVLLLAGQLRMAKPSAPEKQTESAAAIHHASHTSDPVPVKQPAAPEKDGARPASSETETPPPAPVPPALVTPAPVPPVRVEPPVKTGTLALSSPIAAEIYMGGKHVGSTPTTLKLPPGRQTLEYRYRNRSAVVTYEIKTNQTTTALVTFETTVQINAKPWAEVVLEGASRRSLGETPLSDVRVPIGSVLVFENPNFPSKTQTHRVTDEDTAIQVVFQ